MRIAHLSDLHILALDGVPAARFANKRLTGYANLRFKRNHAHRSSYVAAILREIRAEKIDHVVITGDLTNLALESEFTAVRTMLESEFGRDPSRVSIIPGNHDVYTSGAHRSKRFCSFFSEYVTSDLPELGADLEIGRFPYVHLREHVAVIGLSSAVPRLPMVAAGVMGRKQLQALGSILAHPEVKRRFPILLMHHPIHNFASNAKTLLEGLHDAPQLRAVLDRTKSGLLLHGHLHRRMQQPLATREGSMQSVGATSASLSHKDATKMAGFNVYDIDSAHNMTMFARVLHPATETFSTEPVPAVVGVARP